MDQNTITQVINPHSLQATQDAGLPATLVPLHDLCLILSLSLSLFDFALFTHTHTHGHNAQGLFLSSVLTQSNQTLLLNTKFFSTSLMAVTQDLARLKHTQTKALGARIAGCAHPVIHANTFTLTLTHAHAVSPSLLELEDKSGTPDPLHCNRVRPGFGKFIS